MWWRLMAPGYLASGYLLIWRSASCYLGRQAGLLCFTTYTLNQALLQTISKGLPGIRTYT